MEFVKYFTPVGFPNFTQEKSVNRDIFGQELRIEDVLLIYFEQIVSFCAIIYSNTNSPQLFCENSSLNLANFTDRVIFTSPKIFYTIVTCDKFHFCIDLVILISFHKMQYSVLESSHQFYMNLGQHIFDYMGLTPWGETGTPHSHLISSSGPGRSATSDHNQPTLSTSSPSSNIKCTWVLKMIGCIDVGAFSVHHI